MKQIITSSILALAAAVAFGRVPSQSEVQEVAEYLVSKKAFQGILPNRTVESVSWVALEDGYGVWAVKLAPSGHIVMSNSTKFRALISWSEGTFKTPDPKSPQYALLLRAAKRAARAEAGEGEEHISWVVDTTSLLGYDYEDPSPTELPSESIIHPPVDTATWAQDQALTWYVPGIAPCGCVATAHAQIMHALQWPVYAEGYLEASLWHINDRDENNKITTTERYSFSPYSKFNYDEMPLIFTETVSATSGHHAARLMLMGDIIAQMGFEDVGGSGTIGSYAASTPWSMSPTTIVAAGEETEAQTTDESSDEESADEEGDGESSTTAYSADEIETIEQMMSEGIPSLCGIPGHAVVGSGYADIGDDQISELPYVRINYGWADATSGWYPIDFPIEYAFVYPKRTVQCDPLPAVSTATPTISWHLPKCYDNTVSGFKITAHKIPATDSTATLQKWTDDFSTCQGDMAGNTDAIHVATGDKKLTIKLTEATMANDAPKALYTWNPIFVPTATSKWTFTYSFTKARGPVHLQILPLGGVWQTINILDPGQSKSVSAKSASITIPSKYANHPCKLRLFAYPTIYPELQTQFDTRMVFSMKSMSVTNLAQVIDPTQTEADVTLTINDPNARACDSFEEGYLEAGAHYAFMTTPIFKDETVVGTPSMPCYTQIEDGETSVAEDFVTFEVSSPSVESTQMPNPKRMDLSNGVYRLCVYSGNSMIRVKTDPSITALELHSSHPDAFPLQAFEVTSLTGGYFDILVDGEALPDEPTNSRMNDQVNLTLVAISNQGTRTPYELSLQFLSDDLEDTANYACSEDLVCEFVVPVEAGEETYTVSRDWLVENGVLEEDDIPDTHAFLNEDSDSDGLSDAEEYLIGSNPKDETSKLEITGITVNEDGSVSVTYTPNTSTVATYTLYGTDALNGTWKPHTNEDTLHRFFKVVVEPM